MSDNTDHYEGALLEEIRSDIKVVLEGQQAMASIPGDVARLKNDMAEVKSDINVIKKVLTGHSGQLDDHETRLTILEQN